jgi:hypothetical protein
VDPWDETTEPDWFTMPIPSRTSRFSCSRAELPLLRHSWLLICSCVASYLARALACGIEPSRPPVERFRSHSRMRRFSSARTSGSCNFAALSICCDAIRAGLLPPPVLCCTSNPRHVTTASTALPLRQLFLPNLPRYNRRLRFATSPSGSLRHNHSSTAAPLLSCT